MGMIANGVINLVNPKLRQFKMKKNALPVHMFCSEYMWPHFYYVGGRLSLSGVAAVRAQGSSSPFSSVLVCFVVPGYDVTSFVCNRAPG